MAAFQTLLIACGLYGKGNKDLLYFSVKDTLKLYCKMLCLRMSMNVLLVFLSLLNVYD